MIEKLIELFKDTKTVIKIRKKLPKLFQIAQLESSKAGKAGMEVGTIRERIIIALLIYRFGEDNVDTNLSATESEIDVKLFGKGISIKTISGRALSGVKLIWTVDQAKAKEFMESYFPKSEMLLVHINWDDLGGFYYIPLEVQIDTFQELTREGYIKLPKEGTNPRGVEISERALEMLIKDERTKSIEINWFRSDIKFDVYKRWVDLRKED
ncbi:ThaI family type II restriction endonuclease [Thermocrinis sp.]